MQQCLTDYWKARRAGRTRPESLCYVIARRQAHRAGDARAPRQARLRAR